jgi:hypothetical protein
VTLDDGIGIELSEMTSLPPVATQPTTDPSTSTSLAPAVRSTSRLGGPPMKLATTNLTGISSATPSG